MCLCGEGIVDYGECANKGHRHRFYHTMMINVPIDMELQLLTISIVKYYEYVNLC